MADVLVVGAGPVGLTLASELARHGVRCRIVDRLPQPLAYCRAIGVTPRTLEQAFALIETDRVHGHTGGAGQLLDPVLHGPYSKRRDECAGIGLSRAWDTPFFAHLRIGIATYPKVFQ